MWSDSVACLTCVFIKNLINTTYPRSIENARGCALYNVVLPLYNTKGIMLCREGKHWNSGKMLSEEWPKAYIEMKPGFIYTYPNDYDGTLTEICSIESLPKISV